MNYDWDFSVFDNSEIILVSAILVTLKLSLLSSLLGTIAGIPIAYIIKHRFLKYVFLPLNDIGRAVPLLVLMLLLYYFPYESLNIQPLSSYSCALYSMIFAQAVFTGDIIRGALSNVSISSIHGAQSIGLKDFQIFLFVIVPDVLRQILPTLFAFYIGNIKLSSLASAINTYEILYVTKIISGQHFRTLEAWVLVAIIYIIIIVPLSIMSRRFENSKWLKCK